MESQVSVTALLGEQGSSAVESTVLSGLQGPYSCEGVRCDCGEDDTFAWCWEV